MLTHLRVLLGGMLAEVFYLVLRWDRLYGIPYYLLFVFLFLFLEKSGEGILMVGCALILGILRLNRPKSGQLARLCVIGLGWAGPLRSCMGSMNLKQVEVMEQE